jgi:hypothetical protein
MSGSQPSMRTLALWLIPLGGLAAYGAYLTDFGRNLDADDVRWRKVTSSTAPSGVVPDIAFNADASPYAAVTDRNLFVPWRKPSPPPAPPPPPAETPKPQIRRGVYALTGTMQVGDAFFATVKETATNRTKRIQVGDDLQEYKVTKVETDRVVLAFAGQEEELVLARFTQSGRATMPPAPVVAAAPVPPVPTGQPPNPAQPQPIPQGGVPGGVPPRLAQNPGMQRAPDGTFTFPPALTAPPQAGVAAPAAPPQVNPVPVAQPPQGEVIDVGELLRRRREARRQ